MKACHRALLSRPRTILLLALSAVPMLCQAADGMKAGLWELRQKALLDPAMQAQMDQAKQAMANMPAEQRKMMEQMMAQRGVQMNFGTNGDATVTIKACISKEQAERSELPVNQTGHCKYENSRSGNSGRTHFVCKDPEAEGNGEFTFDGPDHYTSKMTIQTRGRTVASTGEGRWLGADCGDLKPRQP